MNTKSRLEGFADLISTRTMPLGTDFSSGCWGAVAKDIAVDHGADPCDYFGFSQDVYTAAIRVNRALPEAQRNGVMLEFTRALAATAPDA
jgi:hypothetical protein